MLILEDDPGIAEALVEYVSSPQLVVFVSQTISHAYELAQRERPDILYLDVYVCGESCLKFIGAFRAILPNAFIVLSSASKNVGLEADKYPINSWLPKPFDISEIDKIVDQMS